MQTSLIIFSGLPGTGKSTLAKRLARVLDFVTNGKGESETFVGCCP